MLLFKFSHKTAEILKAIIKLIPIEVIRQVKFFQSNFDLLISINVPYTAIIARSTTEFN